MEVVNVVLVCRVREAWNVRGETLFLLLYRKDVVCHSGVATGQ
jgi:hypothetical protein